MNLVCVSVHVFRSHQKSQAHEILTLGLIWANLDHHEARFPKFWFLRGSPYGPVLKIHWIYRIRLCSRFPKPPKVTGSYNFGSRPNLGQLRSLRSPIFKILIFKGGPQILGNCGNELPGATPGPGYTVKNRPLFNRRHAAGKLLVSI